MIYVLSYIKCIIPEALVYLLKVVSTGVTEDFYNVALEVLILEKKMTYIMV